MGIVGLVFLVVALVLIGVGIAVGLAACAVTAVLLGVGVISSSIFIGLRSGRSAAGIRAFFLQCGFFGGIPAGAVCAWLVQSIFEGQASNWQILVCGGLGGACVGLLMGLAVDLIFRRLHAWASARLPVSGSDSAREVSRV